MDVAENATSLCRTAGRPGEAGQDHKRREELLAWKYKMPQIAGDASQIVAAVKDWLSDVSFTLKSQTSKNIAALSIAVVLPVRGTDLECNSITGEKSAREPWCEAHPHWCDGGCPELVTNTLHWGLIPAQAASGLHSRYKAEAKGIHGDRTIVEGKGCSELDRARKSRFWWPGASTEWAPSQTQGTASPTL